MHLCKTESLYSRACKDLQHRHNDGVHSKTEQNNSNKKLHTLSHSNKLWIDEPAAPLVHA